MKQTIQILITKYLSWLLGVILLVTIIAGAPSLLASIWKSNQWEARYNKLLESIEASNGEVELQARLAAEAQLERERERNEIIAANAEITQENNDKLRERLANVRTQIKSFKAPGECSEKPIGDDFYQHLLDGLLDNQAAASQNDNRDRDSILGFATGLLENVGLSNTDD